MINNSQKKRVLSGMRPTGPLHIGHWLGALQTWTKLQETHECFFMIADLHALMGEYENPVHIRDYCRQMVVDWLACGIDPKQSTIFIQSRIPEHAELGLILSMLTPLGWLERNPTYKEQLREITERDLTTYGFLGYPVLQAADILLYRAHQVPVGEDQLSHLELTREIVRRFKHLYKQDIFPEPEAILAKQSRLLGIDRRKMSKSYGNAIMLGEEQESLKKKIQSMITDPSRLKLSDPGHPDECNVYAYYQIFSGTSEVEAARQWCVNAAKGCTDCKKNLAGYVDQATTQIREKRKMYFSDMQQIDQIISNGTERARAVAFETLQSVKKLVGLY